MCKADIRKFDAYAREEVASRLERLGGWQPKVFALEEMKRTFDL